MSEESGAKTTLQRFNGKHTDDFFLWKLRAEMLLKGKGLYAPIQIDCDNREEKAKAASILVNALGDGPLRICQAYISEPMEMLAALDKRYSSDRMSSRVACLTAVFSKSFEDGTCLSTWMILINFSRNSQSCSAESPMNSKLRS